MVRFMHTFLKLRSGEKQLPLALHELVELRCKVAK